MGRDSRHEARDWQSDVKSMMRNGGEGDPRGGIECRRRGSGSGDEWDNG